MFRFQGFSRNGGEATGEWEGDRESNIERFFRYELTIALCRGMIDVVVVEIECVSKPEGDEDKAGSLNTLRSLMFM